MSKQKKAPKKTKEKKIKEPKKQVLKKPKTSKKRSTKEIKELFKSALVLDSKANPTIIARNVGGLTNESYCISWKKQKYYLAIKNTISPGEAAIYNILGLKTWLSNTCMVRTWAKGEHVNTWTYSKIKKLMNSLQKIHNCTETVNIPRFDFFMYKGKGLNKLEKEIYEALVLKLSRANRFVLSHNDLVHENILIAGKKINFIDPEYASLNIQGWDLLYFLHSKLSAYDIFKVNKKFKLFSDDELIEKSLLILMFNYQWASTLRYTAKTSAIKKKILRRIDFYFDLYIK